MAKRAAAPAPAPTKSAVAVAKAFFAPRQPVVVAQEDLKRFGAPGSTCYVCKNDAWHRPDEQRPWTCGICHPGVS